MMTEKYVKTSISLAPHLMEKVDDYAAELGVGRSGAIAFLLKQAFDYQEQTKSIQEFAMKMPDLIEEMKKVEGKINKHAK